MIPPSITKTAPITKLDPSYARQSAWLAIILKRPKTANRRETEGAARILSGPMTGSTIGVSVAPSRCC